MRPVIRALAALAALVALAAVASPAAADRALLVAIDDYADPGFGLVPAPAERNIAAMTALLTGPALRYRPADVRTLLNDAATGKAILDAIRDWLGGAGPDERLFLYFSGRSDGDLLPVDARLAADGRAEGGLDGDRLAAALKGLAGRKVTVFLEAPQLVATRATRAIRVEAAGAGPPAPVPTAGLGPGIAVFSGGNGATADFVAAVEGGDGNGNGLVSNAEVFAAVSDAAKDACALDPVACPTFGPPEAAGASPQAAGAPGALTAGLVLDYLARGNTGAVTLEQLPLSPVKVGTRDIRFRVTSPAAGSLVLLDLAEDGTLTQLFPNGYVRDAGRAGAILPYSPIVVPDDYYGLRFNATAPSRGTLIALVTDRPIELPAAVATRSIEVIPRAEATAAYLPAIVGVLTAPPAPDMPPTGWSVATLPYEIVP